MEGRFERFQAAPERQDEWSSKRQAISEHIRREGNIDAPGVSEDEKRRFCLEQAGAAEAQAKEWAKKLADAERAADAWRKILDQLSAREATPGGTTEGFTVGEEAWFEQGEDPSWVTLQEHWETESSLDVEDVDDGLKHRFAVEKKKQIEDALRQGRLQDSEALKEKMTRLDLLIAQYQKGADAGAERAA